MACRGACRPECQFPGITPVTRRSRQKRRPDRAARGVVRVSDFVCRGLALQGTAAERTPAASLTVLGVRIFRLTSTAKPMAGGSPRLLTGSIRADRGSKACDRFSLPGGWRFLHGGERLQRGRSEDSPKACVPRPPSAIRSHAGGGAGAVPRASSDHYEFLPGIGGQSTQGLISSVLENQGNGLAKVRQTFLARFALPIGARHFSAVGDIPWAVSLDDRREFVAHFFILPLRRRSRICSGPGSAWPVHPGGGRDGGWAKWGLRSLSPKLTTK